MAPDCKSGDESLRWFESIPAHQDYYLLTSNSLFILLKRIISHFFVNNNVIFYKDIVLTISLQRLYNNIIERGGIYGTNISKF